MAHQVKSSYKDDFGGHTASAMSARQQLRALEKAEPPDSADDLDRPKKSKKRKRIGSGSSVRSIDQQFGMK